MSARHRQACIDYARNYGLPRAQRLVLAQIADCMRNDDCISFPGVRRLAADLGYSERYVRIILRRLEAAGLLLAASLAGGRGRRTAYRIPGLDQGEICPEPPESSVVVEPVTTAPSSPSEKIQHYYTYYARRDLSSEKRAYWAERIREIDLETRRHWLDTKIARLERRAGSLLATTQRLGPGETRNDFESEIKLLNEQISFFQSELANLDTIEIDIITEEDLLNLEAYYVGFISLQAAEPDVERRKWYQQRIDQARAAYNHALESRGIIAIDGHSPAIDEELEEQIRQEQISQWRNRIVDLAEKRDTFRPGSTRWQRWNNLMSEASQRLSDLLQRPPPLIEYSPTIT